MSRAVRLVLGAVVAAALLCWAATGCRRLPVAASGPHLDAGVLLNMAPLWEIVPSWQKDPKKAWEALENGEYDWAYQAMDHWPDRVKEKCKTDKSLAIAHGMG